MNAPILLAAGVDLLAIGIVIVFIIIPLIGVVTSKLREISQPQMPPRVERNENARIQEQIDEFLRRASQRRGAPPAAESKPAEAIVVEDDAPVGNRIAEEVQKYIDTSGFRRRTEELGEEVVQADQQFNQQVRQGFSAEVGRLALRPGETFLPAEITDVGAPLPDYASRPTLDSLPEAGSGLAALLGSPQNIAQAVIMSEILRRPSL